MKALPVAIALALALIFCLSTPVNAGNSVQKTGALLVDTVSDVLKYVQGRVDRTSPIEDASADYAESDPVRISHTKFRDMMTEVENMVFPHFPRAILVEAHGVGRDTQILPFVADDFDKWRFIFANILDGEDSNGIATDDEDVYGGSFELTRLGKLPGEYPVRTIIVDVLDGEVRPIVTSKHPWMQTAWDPLPHSLGLVEAVRLLSKHGFPLPSDQVFFRRPLYPGVEEASFYFDLQDGLGQPLYYARVGAESKIVERVDNMESQGQYMHAHFMNTVVNKDIEKAHR